MENNFEIDKSHACNTEIKRPLFSIITINRNNAEGLRKTMQSILSQDFSNYEYIIIDGASTDGSVDVIREFLAVPEYAEKISYWVSEPDTGIYNAMNKGIRHAKGEFVNMMNSGDTMLPEVLGRVAKIAREHKGEVLYGAVSCIKENIVQKVIGHDVSFIPYITLPHQACFFSISFHYDYGLYDENYKIASDYDFISKLYVNREKFFFLNLIVCNYDFSGISNTMSEVLIDENEKIRLKYGFKVQNKKNIFYFIKMIVKFIMPGGIWMSIKTVKNAINSYLNKKYNMGNGKIKS